ncbi:MAG TPA: cupin domain-containing protein [Methylomirabilota bacterium]|nr:cupin domain-containing protein [Methylomirabilota bacterium]
MGKLQISVEEMEATRVARFRNLKPSTRAFVDTAIPGYERLIYNVIGRGVTEDPALAPVITDARDFNLTLVKKAPGNRVGLHDHPTVEVFMPLTGRWGVYWGDEAEHEVVLEQWDVISVPPGVMRGFRNLGTEDAYLLAILGGSDAGHVEWSPKVLASARQHGVELDEHGNVTSVRPR